MKLSQSTVLLVSSEMVVSERDVLRRCSLYELLKETYLENPNWQNCFHRLRFLGECLAMKNFQRVQSSVAFLKTFITLLIVDEVYFLSKSLNRFHSSQFIGVRLIIKPFPGVRSSTGFLKTLMKLISVYEVLTLCSKETLNNVFQEKGLLATRKLQGEHLLTRRISIHMVHLNTVY